MTPPTPIVQPSAPTPHANATRTTPTGAVIANVPRADLGIGFTIILGILLFGLAVYFVIKKLLF